MRVSLFGLFRSTYYVSCCRFLILIPSIVWSYCLDGFWLLPAWSCHLVDFWIRLIISIPVARLYCYYYHHMFYFYFCYRIDHAYVIITVIVFVPGLGDLAVYYTRWRTPIFWVYVRFRRWAASVRDRTGARRFLAGGSCRRSRRTIWSVVIFFCSSSWTLELVYRTFL